MTQKEIVKTALINQANLNFENVISIVWDGDRNYDIAVCTQTAQNCAWLKDILVDAIREKQNRFMSAADMKPKVYDLDLNPEQFNGAKDAD